MAVGTDVIQRPFEAVFTPSRIVVGSEGEDGGSLRYKAQMGGWLLIIFLANLLLYTIPLSLAGIGTVDPSTSAPAWFVNSFSGIVTSSDEAWRFSLRLFQNSIYLLMAGLLTLVSFHVGALLTFQSRGILTSFRVVTYSTGLYLATIFTLVWYASTSSNIAIADDIIIALQTDFIYYFIDHLNAGLELPGGRSNGLPSGQLTTHGKFVIGSLLAAVCYYAYVLYQGARKGHGMTRITSSMVVVFVATTPALFVIGSILVVQLGISPLEVIFR